MSRVGKQVIEIPSGVSVSLQPEQVMVTGPKGELAVPALEGITVTVQDNMVSVSRKSDEPLYRSRHGLQRSLIANMIMGVSNGFSKQLELNGVGYRVALSGSDLKLHLGLSHEVVYPIPTGITVAVDQNIITVSGNNKQAVGQVAADIRALKKPEPYKGKGIKYQGERILRKSGKSGKEK